MNIVSILSKKTGFENLQNNDGYFPLKQLVLAAETRATDQEKRATNLENTLERTLAELNELKKNVSEKESLLKNMAQEIERLELENRN